MLGLKRIKDYIGISEVGWLELIIALYPILAGYGYGSFKLSFGVLFILDVIIVFSGKIKFLNNTSLVVLFSFIVIHDIAFMAVIPKVTSYYINSMISTIIYVVSVFIIAPQLDFKKLRSSIVIVAIICMGGMIYHVLLLSMGQSVSPIKLPFLPEMAKTSRLFAINERPTSFFWEPQSYASFMLVPLFFMLRENKMLFAFIIAATMFISTSTTGLVLSILMMAFVLFKSRTSWFVRLLCVVGIFLLILFLVNSEYTVGSYEKLMNTNLEESNRIINGFLIASDLDLFDFLLGIPFANAQDAYDIGYFHVPLIVMADGELFISAIWISLIQYGIICTVIFLFSYYKLYKMDKQIFPYLICIVVALFSNPDFIGSSYVFQLLIMLTVIEYDKNLSLSQNNY